MINRTDLQRLAPAERADVIYRGARDGLNQRLWRAALGEAEGATSSQARPSHKINIDALVRMMTAPAAPADIPTASPAPTLDTAAPGSLALGPNASHGDAIARAAARTGIPEAALAAIVDAEAAKGRDGSWQSLSRNPRSSAAGLGQFLSGTWIGEAQRTGTWLHGEAERRGWLDERGKVLPGARTDLLALRYDPTASIQATADYARGNLDRLKRSGADIGGSVEDIARAAYLAHHLGPGDAVRFLREGLSDGRAGVLLAAQVGRNAAATRIAAAGEPAQAHRQWLTAYVERHVRPEKFLA